MDLIALLAIVAIEVMFFATWVAIAAAVVWLRGRISKTPVEVLQFRIFEQHRQLEASLTFIAVGTFGGILSIAPFMVAVQPPIVWSVLWTAVWAFGLSWGFISLARAFTVRMPEAPREKT